MAIFNKMPREGVGEDHLEILILEYYFTVNFPRKSFLITASSPIRIVSLHYSQRKNEEKSEKEVLKLSGLSRRLNGEVHYIFSVKTLGPYSVNSLA